MIRIIRSTISLQELRGIAKEGFGALVKAVIDIERSVMAIGGDMHADEEHALLADGSIQENLWGINFYPELPGDQWVEFDSMINVRPSQKNLSRMIEDKAVQKKIMEIVAKMVTK